MLSWQKLIYYSVVSLWIGSVSVIWFWKRKVSSLWVLPGLSFYLLMQLYAPQNENQTHFFALNISEIPFFRLMLFVLLTGPIIVAIIHLLFQEKTFPKKKTTVKKVWMVLLFVFSILLFLVSLASFLIEFQSTSQIISDP